MFIHYAQETCHFECILTKIASDFPCLPWDMQIPPGLDHSDYIICDNIKAGWFRGNFSVLSGDKECEERCSDNCEQVKFKFQTNTYVIHEKEICEFNFDIVKMGIKIV